MLVERLVQRRNLMIILIFVSVLKDDFRATPADTDAAVGETVSLDCSAPRGRPEPEVVWLKDGQVVQPGGRVQVQLQGGLVVRGVHKEDAGRYVCRAVNMAGTRETQPVKLGVHGK